MSKNCTPLWREAHFEVKTCKKTEDPGALFGVLTSKNCTPLWREARFEVKMFLQKLRVRAHFLKFRCRKIAHP